MNNSHQRGQKRSGHHCPANSGKKIDQHRDLNPLPNHQCSLAGSRLDFTCMGPAVNYAAWIEKLAGALGR